MNDTPEAVQHFYRTLLMARSGSERLHMGCAMFDTARASAVLASGCSPTVTMH